MADIKQIQFKRTNVLGKLPLSSDLSEGELAINLADGIIFTKDSSNIIPLGYDVKSGGTGAKTPSTARINLKAAESGINNDITSLIALQGPLRLGEDASNPYDAVTLRQLQASSGGSGGANISGVMNNFIGAVEWFNGSRAKLPAGCIPADGQLESRTDSKTKELWAAIDSGFLISVSDSEWVNGTGLNSEFVNRASYSKGDGTTTFRVIDLNGLQSKSLKPYLRGDGGTSTIGTVLDSAAPEIIGQISTSGSGVFSTAYNANSALNPTGPAYPDSVTPLKGLQSANAIQVKASNSSKVYGRDSSTEVRPQTATGLWVIRANGAFTSANTAFNVINADETTPSNGITVFGGDLISKYDIAGVEYAKAIFRAKAVIGSKVSAEIVLLDNSSGNNVETKYEINNGISASVGYSLVDFGIMSQQTRKVMPNPFGNNTPVITTLEILVNGNWYDPGWIFINSGNSGRGTRGGFVMGEGLVAITGSGGVSGTNKYQTGGLGPDGIAPINAYVRMHVWKLNP